MSIAFNSTMNRQKWVRIELSYWDFDWVQATWTSFLGHRNISKVSTITKVHIVIHSCIILPPLISNVGIHRDPSFPKPGRQPETSPSPPSQHTVEPQEFSAPPPGHDASITPANPIQHGVSPAPKPPQQSQQSQANDPPSKIYRSHFQAQINLIVSPTLPFDCNQDVHGEVNRERTWQV